MHAQVTSVDARKHEILKYRQRRWLSVETDGAAGGHSECSNPGGGVAVDALDGVAI